MMCPENRVRLLDDDTDTEVGHPNLPTTQTRHQWRLKRHDLNASVDRG